MTAHFSDDYQLEAIRSDLHKVLGAVSNLLPTKPVLAEPTLFDAPKLSNEHYYSGSMHYGKRTPRPVEPASDCEMTAAPVDPLIDSLRAEIARVTAEWGKLSRKHDILLLKLRDIHAISSDPS